MERPVFDQAVDIARNYVESVRDQPVGPTPDQIAALEAFGSVSIDAPIEPDEAIQMLDALGSPATMRSTGGRYFGFVNGGTVEVARAAAIVAGAWDQNAALSTMSPTAAAIDTAAAEMIVDALGLPSSATATFCGGATVANITGIVTARDALLGSAGWDVHADGLAGAPPIRVVISEEAHVSVHKALRIAGFGQRDVVVVPADANGAMDAAQLPEPAGLTLVLAQAGNVNTGHSDPFEAIVDRLGGPETWVHVDGAFGLWANAAPARRSSVRGVERADSWATDGHKWLNVPYDCGVLVVADGRHLRHSMRMDAAYVPSGDDERSLMNLGLQMSQAARGVPVWSVLATSGRDGVADSIEHSCRCAERFAEGLLAMGAEVLAPVVINQALVAFGDDQTTDDVVARVQAAGVCWMGATTWQGRRAMRISVSDLSTTFDDVDAALASIERCWIR
ncbi:MAG: pyridoxal-dependent decarboxylase [Actinomycetota bacterium]